MFTISQLQLVNLLLWKFLILGLLTGFILTTMKDYSVGERPWRYDLVRFSWQQVGLLFLEVVQHDIGYYTFNTLIIGSHIIYDIYIHALMTVTLLYVLRSRNVTTLYIQITNYNHLSNFYFPFFSMLKYSKLNLWKFTLKYLQCWNSSKELPMKWAMGCS